MLLWSHQPVEVLNIIERKGVYRCNIEKSGNVIDSRDMFINAYDWIVEQMKARGINPPVGVQYPIWAWHTLYWRPQKPDFRGVEFDIIENLAWFLN